jgi:DNA (cytosine-5)-methyltransferase 1
LPTVSANGTHMAAVAAFLVRYNTERSDASARGQKLDEPASTIDTSNRLGLVTITIHGEEYILADVGMRMLTPRELFNAQGFDANYDIEPEFEGKPLTKTAQIRCVGNSVPPQMADVIARAQLQVA